MITSRTSHLVQASAPLGFNTITLIAVFLLSTLMIGCGAEELPTASTVPTMEPQAQSFGKTDADEELSTAPESELTLGAYTQAPKGCIFDADDAYEPRSVFQSGPWEGVCHDTQRRRPTGFVDDELAARYQGVDDHYVLYNVFHEDGFWFAFVPYNAVKRVYFQLEYFPAVIPAGHTQLRLEYDRPVTLYGQSGHLKGRIDQTHNLSLSIEAVTRVGDRYDLFKGAQEHFAIAYRVTSMEARFNSMITEQDHHVEQWRLNLTSTELEALLPHYVSTSADHNLAFSYHTLFKNCTTEIIEILDGIGEYTWRERVQKFLVKVTEIYPNIVRAALIARGLLPLNQSTDWFPLEEDEAFIVQMEREAVAH